MSLLAFRFRFDPIERVPASRGQVTWYLLSSGAYMVQLGHQSLLTAIDANGQVRWTEYDVVRLWEDLLEIVPAILAPVPAEIAAMLDPAVGCECLFDAAWAHSKTLDDASFEGFHEAFELASRWMADRTLDVGYLAGAPRITFARVGDRVWVTTEPRSTPRPDWTWACTPTRVDIGVDDFLDAVRTFDRAFIDGMAARLREVRAGRLPNAASAVAHDLWNEHDQRAGRLRVLLDWNDQEPEDWAAVVAAIESLRRVVV